MKIHKNNIAYLTLVLFMLPLIILPSIILNVDIETTNLENIISSSDNKTSECYNLTYSFIYQQNSDERYISLKSYLRSFISVCIVIIIAYSLKIMFSINFAFLIERGMRDGANGMYLFFIAGPVRILAFIPSIVCVILLRIRSYTDNCEQFMNYYNLCLPEYGENFKNNFSDIMNIKTYTLCVLIFFVWEIVYNVLIMLFIGAQN